MADDPQGSTVGVAKSEGGGSEENNNAGSCIGSLLVTAGVAQGVIV